MKRLLKIVSLFLVFALCLSVTVYASDGVDPRGSDFFIKNNAYLYKTGTYTFEIWFDSVAFGVMDELGSTCITLERSSNGTSGWTTVKTYYPSSYPQMLATDRGTYANYVTYTGSSGYYYRACVEFYAENSNGSSYKYLYTDTIKIV